MFIDSIRINNLPKGDRKLVLDKLSLVERSYMTFEQIEKGINRVASTLNFESVSYDVVNDGHSHYLYIDAVPREEKRLGININHFSTTNSSLVLNGQIRNFLFRLSNLRATMRLSENMAVGGEYFVRGGPNSKNWVFGGRLETQRYDMLYHSNGRQRKNGFMWEGYITPYVTYEFNNYTSLRLDLEVKSFAFENELLSDFDIDRLVETGSKSSFLFTYDDRDARAMTREGLLLYGHLGFGFHVNSDLEYNVAEASDVLDFPLGNRYAEAEFFFAQTIPMSQKLWFTFMGDIYYKSNPSILDNYTVGGTTLEGRRNLPFMGYREQELRTDQHIFVRSGLRLGVFENVSVELVGNLMVGESKVFRYSDPGRDDTFTAYGIGLQFGIMLPIGPVLLDMGYNSESNDIRADLSIGWKHFF